MIDNPDISSILKCLDLDMLNKASKYRVADKIIVRVGNSDSGEPILVALTDDPNEIDAFIFDTAQAVGINDLTQIIEYTVPPSKVFNLDNIAISGSNIAKYTVKINNNINKVMRTYYGGSLSENIRYNSYRLIAGDKIEVEVIHHNDLLMSGDFEATIEGKIKDE